jgi:adenylate cyclase
MPDGILGQRVGSREQPTMSRRLGLWVTVLALPLAALALLAAEPDVDRRWEHHPSHFWLVLTVAGVNVALGLIASEAASRRDDDRTFLVTFRFGQSSVSLAGPSDCS